MDRIANARYAVVLSALATAGCASSKSSAPLTLAHDAADGSADAASDTGCSSTYSSECPAGCAPDIAQKHEPIAKCLAARAPARCVPAKQGCTGALTCLVRVADGALFRFSDDCQLRDGWRDSTTGEQDLIGRATDCAAADAASGG